jgi:diacylglycerol kinase (ATP)
VILVDHARRILMIANPASRKGRGARLAQEVVDALRAAAVEVELTFTNAPGHAFALAREAAGQSAVPNSDTSCTEARRWTCIAACGGDGTIQEVAGALATVNEAAGARVAPPLGVMPAGRCNDFARALGIAPKPAEIAEALLHGVVGPIDLGCANGRHFCTVATLGIDAEVSSYVDGLRLPLTGTLAYVYGALQVIRRYRGRPMRLTGDFGTIDEPMTLATSANTSFYGGALPIAPPADPTDGLLHICLVRAVSRRRLLVLLPKLLRATHLEMPEVSIEPTRELRIESEEPQEIWADGERLTHTPAHIKVVPAAIDVLRPAPSIA